MCDQNDKMKAKEFHRATDLRCGEVEAEETENHLFQEIVVELRVIGEKMAPDAAAELSTSSSSIATAALVLRLVSVSPRLDVAQPSLKDQPKAGVKRPVIEKVFEEVPKAAKEAGKDALLQIVSEDVLK